MKAKPFFASLLLSLFPFVGTMAAKKDDGVITFAIVADSHVTWSGGKATKVLKEIVADINSRSVDFVIHAGDEANVGRLDQFEVCRDVMNELRAPYYVIPGNHDGCWSESGGTDFEKVFGDDHFCFKYKGWRFVGCPCGPQAHIVKPALIPRESLQWIESLEPDSHSVFFVHSPATEREVSNAAEYLDLIRSKGAAILIGGHTHKDEKFDYNGLPGFVCRNTESHKVHPGIGYTIVRMGNNVITASECCKGESGFEEKEPWYSMELKPESAIIPAKAEQLPTATCRAYTSLTPEEGEVWRSLDKANIISGFAVDSQAGCAYYGNTAGELKCISLADGTVKWTYKMSARSLSTPAVSDGVVVTGCTSGEIIAVNAATGKKQWAVRTERALIASPLIKNGIVYIGSSDQRFFALDLKKGRVVWTIDSGIGPVQAAMTFGENRLIVADWDKTVFSLDPATGKVLWRWKVEGSGNLMFSAGGCKPVIAGGRVFFGTPEQKLHALDLSTGKELWTLPDVRESLGLSEDEKTLFAKSQKGKLYAIEVGSDKPKWCVEIYKGTDTCRSPLVCKGGCILNPSYKGILFYYNESDGSYVSEHKISIAPVNPIQVIEGVGILASTMDGYITLIK